MEGGVEDRALWNCTPSPSGIDVPTRVLGLKRPPHDARKELRLLARATEVRFDGKAIKFDRPFLGRRDYQ
jgi:hypothetical protein